ncbi:lipopolysaccharide biosynthesis protein [Bacteroides zoogleoformans]|uniref:lipopolysaccharide biosynthesis protein n=1 Tax=Bacteroides zoogleoformans TaxID=28119 RepID=UPI00248D9596|nr:lipopolysaccharide biosynthesis protein [Bacteroides zoogleoformans]
MNETSLKEKTAKGLLWGGFSNGMQQLLNLAFGIVLARLLDVSDYGMVGMLTIFSAIAAALQEGGFISALTNRKEVSHKDYNAVFWFSTLCGITLYVLLFFAAPLIADFYETPELVPLSRLSFLGFVISSLSIAPRAYLFRNLKIKETTVVSLSALCVSGVVGIILAANGFAYWGIALQSIAFVTMVTILNFYFSRWRPTLQLDFTPIREMIGFSSKMIVTNIFTIINNNLLSVLLGRFYSEREVGNFTQANKWNGMGHNTITGMINGIAQPVFTRVTDDKPRQLAVFRKLLRFTAFVSFPAMFGLSLIARELIVIAVTEKWLGSVYIMQILCIWGAFIPVINLFSNLVISRGHSSIYMRNTICLSVLQLVAVCAMYPFGLEWMLRVFVGINIGWLFVWFGFVRREIGLKAGDMLKDLSPYLLLSAALVTAACYIARPIENLYLSLITKVVFVAGLYALTLWKLQSVIFKESVEFLLKKKKP